MSRLDYFVFFAGFAVPLGKTAKPSMFSKEVIMSFCPAGVALRDIPRCFLTASKVVLCDRRNSLAMFSEDDLHFPW